MMIRMKRMISATTPAAAASWWACLPGSWMLVKMTLVRYGTE